MSIQINAINDLAKQQNMSIDGAIQNDKIHIKKEIKFFFDQYGNLNFKYNDDAYQVVIAYEKNHDVIELFKEKYDETQYDKYDHSIGKIHISDTKLGKKILEQIEEEITNSNEQDNEDNVIDDEMLNYNSYLKTFPERIGISEIDVDDIKNHVDQNVNSVAFYSKKNYKKNIVLNKKNSGIDDNLKHINNNYEDDVDDNVTYDCFIFDSNHDGSVKLKNNCDNQSSDNCDIHEADKLQKSMPSEDETIFRNDKKYKNCCFTSKTTGYPCYSICVYMDGFISLRKLDKNNCQFFELTIENDELKINKK